MGDSAGDGCGAGCIALIILICCYPPAWGIILGLGIVGTLLFFVVVFIWGIIDSFIGLFRPKT